MRIVIVSALACICSVATAADVQMAHQGRLLSADGEPINADDATVQVILRGLNDSLAHDETFPDVDIDDGYYTVVLGSRETLDSGVFLAPPVTIEIIVNTVSLGTSPFLSTAHAAAADVTRSVPIQGALADRACTSEGAIAWDSGASRIRVCASGRWTFDGEASIALVNGARQWSNGSYAKSCNDYLHPADSLYSYTGDTGDGVYTIDPDGIGAGAAFNVTCDMTTSGGGWTRIVYQNYDEATTGWNQNGRSQCGTWGWLHGGYNTFSTNPITTTLSLGGVSHTEARFTTTFVKIDSWDNETATLTLDGVQRWSGVYVYTNGTSQCGNPASPEWKEEGSAIDVTFAHAANTLAVSFSANLSTPGTDESWGHDDLTVWVR